MPKAIFAYGRMNPPTRGHKALINTLLLKAKDEGATPFIVVTHTQNKKKNPLNVNRKSEILKLMFPGVEILSTSKSEPSPIGIVKKLRDRGFNNVQMMVGSNRVGQFGFVGIPVLSGGQRNMTSSVGLAGVKATYAREAAKAGNFNLFKSYMNERLNNNTIRQIMSNVRAGMGLKN